MCACVFKNSSHTQNMFQTHLPNKCLFYVAEIRALENHAFDVFHFWSKNAECQPTYVKERTNVFLKRMRAFQNILGLYICLSICPSVYMAFFFSFQVWIQKKISCNLIFIPKNMSSSRCCC